MKKVRKTGATVTTN